jgi:hypothetical protein
MHHQIHEGSSQTSHPQQLLLLTLWLRLPLRLRGESLAALSQRRVPSHSSRPSMSANTPEDATLKVGLVDDVMTVINIEGV